MLPNIGDTTQDVVEDAIYDATLVAGAELQVPGRNEWLATREAEVSRATRFAEPGASTTRSEREIASDYGQRLADTMLATLKQKCPTWTSNAYWFLQIRGIKQTTWHTQEAGGNTPTWIGIALDGVRLTNSHIYLDMALMFKPQDPTWSIQPIRDQAREFAQELFGIEPFEWDNANPLYDMVCHSATIAGARVNFKAEPVTASKISYFNEYTTEKFHVYNAGSFGERKAMHLSGLRVLHMTGPDAILGPVRRVYNNVHDCRHATPEVQSLLRIEVRVPLEHAATVLPNEIDTEWLKERLDLVRTRTLWYALPSEQIVRRLTSA